MTTTQPEHQPRYGRTPLGTPTWGNLRGAAGTRYGTTVRCSCGWRTQVNVAPSRGGRQDAQEAWERHVATQGQR
jgi:hypothetical protein